MTYRINHRLDSEDSTTLIIIEEGVQGYWTIISTADGQESIIRPTGTWTDGLFVDSRHDTPEGRLLAWLGDQDF